MMSCSDFGVLLYILWDIVFGSSQVILLIFFNRCALDDTALDDRSRLRIRFYSGALPERETAHFSTFHPKLPNRFALYGIDR